MQDLNSHELDRHITGNWGEDSVGPESPEFTDEELAYIGEALAYMHKTLSTVIPRSMNRNLEMRVSKYLEAMGW
jgi:hypothetical protein